MPPETDAQGGCAPLSNPPDVSPFRGTPANGTNAPWGYSGFTARSAMWKLWLLWSQGLGARLLQRLVLRWGEEPWPSLAKGYPFASASWVHCSAPQELSNLGLEVSGALNLSTIRVISSHIMAGSLRTWTQQEAQGGSNGAEGWRLGRRH